MPRKKKEESKVNSANKCPSCGGAMTQRSRGVLECPKCNTWKHAGNESKEEEIARLKSRLAMLESPK